MGVVFFLIALILCAYAYLSPASIAPGTTLISLFCCTEMQRQGFYMASSILCLMGGYCLASALGMY